MLAVSPILQLASSRACMGVLVYMTPWPLLFYYTTHISIHSNLEKEHGMNCRCLLDYSKVPKMLLTKDRHGSDVPCLCLWDFPLRIDILKKEELKVDEHEISVITVQGQVNKTGEPKGKEGGRGIVVDRVGLAG